jgi:CopG family nickel-responsive transcriptional regulator
MDDLIRFGVSLPKKLLDDFDKDNEKRGYANRSEAIRDLIRNRLVEAEWEDGVGESAAAVVLVYDHHKHGVTEQLTQHQHDHHEYIISSLHAHLDHDNCMEVILLRGNASQIRTIAENLASSKHVKLGKFIPATLGNEIE